jgi:hypothetical protein
MSDQNHEAAPKHPFAGLAPALSEQDLEAVAAGQDKAKKVPQPPRNTGIVREDGANGLPARK